MMIAAVAVAAALAAAGAAVAMAGRRRWGYRGVAVAVAVCVHAAVLLSAVVYLSVVPSAGPGASSSSSSLQETEVMKLTAKMEQIIENQEKYGKSDGMMYALASFLSKNPRIIKEMTYRITNPDGTEKAELAVTMKNDVKVQSPRTNDILDM
uniref:Expressed protein n=2 Tax=Oryza TaxID=4527 RepID=Q2R3G1_ORYSJ|nr:expressed protein [Oryza sativa Japonica Group]